MDDLPTQLALSCASHRLRNISCDAYLRRHSKSYIILSGPNQTTVSLLGHIPSTVLHLLTSFSVVVPQTQEILLECDLFNLVKFAQDLCRFTGANNVTRLKITYPSQGYPNHVLDNGLVPYSIISLLASFYQPGRTWESIDVQPSDLQWPFPTRIFKPHHRQSKVLRSCTPAYKRLYFRAAQAVHSLLSARIHGSFLLLPSLLSPISPLLLCGKSMNTFMLECHTVDQCDLLLPLIKFPELEAFSLRVEDHDGIKIPPDFFRRHGKLELLRLHSFSTQPGCAYPLDLNLSYLPALTHMALSSNFTSWKIARASALSYLQISPLTFFGTPPDTPHYCAAVRELCMLMQGSRAVHLPDRFTLHIAFPYMLSNHAKITSALLRPFPCSCASVGPRHSIPSVKSLEVSIDVFDQHTYVSINSYPFSQFTDVRSLAIPSQLARMVSGDLKTETRLRSDGFQAFRS